MQEEGGLSIKAIDDAVAASRIAPMGPFFLTDLLGLDTVLHVAQHLQECYGDSFYVHEGMRALVEAGELGAKTGKGFYEDGKPRTRARRSSTPTSWPSASCSRRSSRRACVLEEGMATVRDIDLGMMAGAGMMPRPVRARRRTGLDNVLDQLETAAEQWGERFAPPMILRRLVAQGRLGAKTGQGFFAYARPDESGFEQGEAVKLETRDDVAIAWLDRPPANSLSPQVIAELRRVWEHVGADEAVRALIIASANPMLWCAGRGHQGVHASSTPRPAPTCSTTRTSCCGGWSSPRP